MIVISITIDLTIDFTNMKVNQAAAASPTVLAEAARVGEALARVRISRRVQQNEAAIFVQGSGLGGAHPKATSSAGSLIRTHKSYIQQRYTYDGQCKAAGLSNMHGLRHRYAQDRYEALTDWKTPAAGGLRRGH